MEIDRRRLLQLSGALAGAYLLPRGARGQERFIPRQGPWRKFDLVSQLKIAKPKGKLQVWMPVPSVSEDDWSKALGSDWTTNAKVAKLWQDKQTGADCVYLEWDDSEPEATAEISSHAETRDRVTDFTRPQKADALAEAERQRFLGSVSFMPLDERLKETAAKITQNAETDLGKAKAIYEWIIEERTCDAGDLPSLPARTDALPSEPQDCDYLNSLFVGLCRVSGVPARAIYGVRVAPSQFAYDSLGAVSEDITAKTHARAEVWLAEYGWVPVDPADVRRVIRDEPPGDLPLTDPKAVAARTTLFGAWEGNWIAYNMGNDIVLPGSDGLKVPYLNRPIVKTPAGLIGKEMPKGFSYKLMANELPA